MLINILGGIASGLIGLFGQRGAAKAQEIQARVSNMQRSGTDEFIVIVLFAPLVVAWFSETEAQAYIQFLEAAPDWYRNLIFAVTGAVFGLGKLNGRKK